MLSFIVNFYADINDLYCPIKLYFLWYTFRYPSTVHRAMLKIKSQFCACSQKTLLRPTEASLQINSPKIRAIELPEDETFVKSLSPCLSHRTPLPRAMYRISARMVSCPFPVFFSLSLSFYPVPVLNRGVIQRTA